MRSPASPRPARLILWPWRPAYPAHLLLRLPRCVSLFRRCSATTFSSPILAVSSLKWTISPPSSRPSSSTNTLITARATERFVNYDCPSFIRRLEFGVERSAFAETVFQHPTSNVQRPTSNWEQMRRYSQRQSLSTLSEINVTPLLDLAFVLLIIFMITTPLLESSMNLVIPSSSATNPPINKAQVQTVSIDRAETIRINNQVDDLG